MDAADPKVVLVHDWLTGMRGGEKCLEVFCDLWPDAPLYTLLHRSGSVCPEIENHSIHTSFLQWLPQVHRYYRYLLPLMPLTTGWRFPDCNVVLSSSHCVAKSVRPPEGVPHICYCFSPMRYVWHMRKSYFGTKRQGIKAWCRDKILSWIREWDRRTAANVTHFIAISKTIQTRIRECYGRTSSIIYPPVDTDFYSPANVNRQDYYLVVSAFAPYKRIDLAIEACNSLQRKLVIIGKGQEEKKLRAMAGPTIHFLGWQSDEAIRDYFRSCRALLFPGEEDFGIVPVETQACGTPVIAFGRGGATETVIPQTEPYPTGIWFEEQSAESLTSAILEFEALEGNLNPDSCRRNAVQFNKARFYREIRQYVETVISGNDRLSRAA